MKILFSVYKEDKDSEEVTFVYRECIITDVTIQDIDKKLNLYDGFHYDLIVGQTICFWDIYCFFDDYNDIIDKIISITRVEEKENSYKESKVLLMEPYDPGDVGDAKLPDFEKTFLFKLNRYECGANSYEAVILWFCEHPLAFAMMYDSFKFAIRHIFRALKINTWDWMNKSYVYLNIDSFYKNFSKAVQKKREHCQIIYIHTNDRDDIDVTVRTIDGEKYYVKSNARGKINGLKIDE